MWSRYNVVRNMDVAWWSASYVKLIRYGFRLKIVWLVYGILCNIFATQQLSIEINRSHYGGSLYNGNVSGDLTGEDHTF